MGENELQTQMVSKYTRDGKPVLSGIGLEPGAANTYLGYGKPWVIKWNDVVYHFYNAVGNQGRVIALATSKDLNRQTNNTSSK